MFYEKTIFIFSLVLAGICGRGEDGECEQLRFGMGGKHQWRNGSADCDW